MPFARGHPTCTIHDTGHQYLPRKEGKSGGRKAKEPRTRTHTVKERFDGNGMAAKASHVKRCCPFACLRSALIELSESLSHFLVARGLISVLLTPFIRSEDHHDMGLGPPSEENTSY